MSNIMQAWIYEHFPTIGRPQHNVAYVIGEPLAMRWSQQTHGAGTEASVKAYRELLDLLQPHEVISHPYSIIINLII